MELLDNIKNFQEKYNLKVEELKTCSAEIFTPLFEKYPKLENFAWTQYTPYFSYDDDERVFGVQADEPEINGLSHYEIHSEKERYGSGKHDYKYRPIQENLWMEECQRDVSKAVYEIGNQILKSLYGDHCKITIHRNGKINIEYYEHE